LQILFAPYHLSEAASFLLLHRFLWEYSNKAGLFSYQYLVQQGQKQEKLKLNLKIVLSLVLFLLSLDRRSA
jgi:asparagine N-glycosylation enzyme membrane subunit Stt3